MSVAAPSSARFAELGDGLRLAFRTAGSGDGSPVVLVPGFASHVAKPFEPEALGEVVEKLLASRKVGDAAAR